MNILFVYPKYPDTFWGFQYALKFVNKKAAFPPLGLLTIAAMLPLDWEKKLVDMNVSSLEDRDIQWADMVFVGAMITQKESAKEVIKHCNKLGVKVVAGGPVFTTGYEEFEGVDHFVLGEAESTLQPFLDDLERGIAKRIYESEERPVLTKTPIPLWKLINPKNYVAMPLQYSRGCPFDCEFCDIVVMNGHTPRLKTIDQTIRELDAIYATGFRGSLFIVDDNFIGNKIEVKKLLVKLIEWQFNHGYPFRFLTEASLNLAKDEELMQKMNFAGFDKVFVGLETPAKASLNECGKKNNEDRDQMLASVREIQNHGMEVLGGFIVGFDNDPSSIFEDQISFIQESGVVVAMVGILTALPKTRLYKRLEKEGRLVAISTGNNSDANINFIPKMDEKMLKDGYYRVLSSIFSPKYHGERIVTFMRNHKGAQKKGKVPRKAEIVAFLKSIWYLGIANKGRRYYWKTLFLSFQYGKPVEGVTDMIYGYHFRRVVAKLQK